MSLIKCRACGHSISRRAKSCPSCGEPKGPKPVGTIQGTLAILATIVVVSLLASNIPRGASAGAPRQSASSPPRMDSRKTTADPVATPQRDPIIGTWVMDRSGSESYSYVLEFRPHGRLRLKFMSKPPIDGTWERVTDGRYRMRPSASDDYMLLSGERLEMWDSEGLIRVFGRKP